jgi:hypothetical protein
MNAKNLKGALLASAVCAMFASAAHAGDDTAPGHAKAGGDVKCAGINSCKGTGACASADNGCGGKNGCKGKGWVATKTAKECTDKGGKVVASK